MRPTHICIDDRKLVGEMQDPETNGRAIHAICIHFKPLCQRVMHRSIASLFHRRTRATADRRLF